MTTLGIIISILCVGLIIYIVKKAEIKGCTGNCYQGRRPCDCRGKE